MYQIKFEFLDGSAAEVFDQLVVETLRLIDTECDDPAFIMITSDNSKETPSRSIATDDPDLFARLSEIKPD